MAEGSPWKIKLNHSWRLDNQNSNSSFPSPFPQFAARPHNASEKPWISIFLYFAFSWNANIFLSNKQWAGKEMFCSTRIPTYNPQQKSRELECSGYTLVNYAKSLCNWIIENSEWIVSHTNMWNGMMLRNSNENCCRFHCKSSRNCLFASEERSLEKSLQVCCKSLKAH